MMIQSVAFTFQGRLRKYEKWDKAVIANGTTHEIKSFEVDVENSLITLILRGDNNKILKVFYLQELETAY